MLPTMRSVRYGPVKPLFGKLALRNHTLVHGETYFMLGLGPHLRVAKNPGGGDGRSEWLPAANVGIGFRFWSSESFSMRFAVRDYLIFANWVPENSLLLMLSGSFDYYNREPTAP